MALTLDLPAEAAAAPQTSATFTTQMLDAAAPGPALASPATNSASGLPLRLAATGIRQDGYSVAVGALWRSSTGGAISATLNWSGT
jgi:hypothetical protein